MCNKSTLKILFVLLSLVSIRSHAGGDTPWEGPTYSMLDDMDAAQLREHRLQNHMIAKPYTAQESSLRARFIAKYGYSAFFRHGASMLRYTEKMEAAIRYDGAY